MANLVIDIGNTFTKVAIFDNRRITDLFVFDQLSVKDIQGITEAKQIERSIISSVDQDTEELEAYLKSSSDYFRFTTEITTRVINHYKTPKTLGLDRFAAVIGAEAIFPQKNCLVIDAGTCITYDFIDKDRNYSGGSISPGLTMRFKAMHTFTGRLPLIEFDAGFNESYGMDTRSAILSGVQEGIINEVLGFIGRYSSKYSDLQVILCGGDVNFFDTRMKNSIFANSVKTEPQLVLIGLNEVIHQYNND